MAYPIYPSSYGESRPSTIQKEIEAAGRQQEDIHLRSTKKVRNYSIESLRNRTGILLGSQDIFRGTLWENLTMGNSNIKTGEVKHLVQITGLQPFVESCKNGYDTELLPVGNKLSNTTRKNILLIRALLGGHRLLLLEEPFDHLEPPYKSQTINHIRKDIAVTILIASRDEELGNYCDKVILISKDGLTGN